MPIKIIIFCVLFFQFLTLVYSAQVSSIRILNDDIILRRKKIDENRHFYKIGKLVSRKTVAVNAFFAEAYLETDMNSTGWNVLEVRTYPEFDDATQAYYGGLIEGCVSTKLIYLHWYNTYRNYCNEVGHERCEKITNFIIKNTEWTKLTTNKYKGNSSYWWQVYLNYEQIRGISEGYELCRDKSEEVSLTYLDFLLLNADGDRQELVEKFKNSNCLRRSCSPSQRPWKLYGEGRCSAIIKLLPGNEDLYVAHATWTKYNYLIRVLKRYIFNYHELPNSEKLVPGNFITFSGFPGVISSVDDFYSTSSKLVVTETTIGNSNDDRWIYVNPEGCVFTFIRTMVANRLAKDGRSWSKMFVKFNSGTYNNQWMVIDYNKFIPNQNLTKDLLWVLEQLPGYIRAQDRTNILKKKTYWPSYNTPYYSDVFNMSGDAMLEELYGDSFSYDRAPRAKIMRRDHTKIKNFDSLMTFIRSNDYKNDPYSRCDCIPPYSASYAISARHDLNVQNGTYPYPKIGPRSGGAIDAKAINSSLLKNLQFMAVSGPTTGNNLPVFKWSESYYFKKLSHLGHPDEWNFTPIITNWVITDKEVEDDKT